MPVEDRQAQLATNYSKDLPISIGIEPKRKYFRNRQISNIISTPSHRTMKVKTLLKDKRHKMHVKLYNPTAISESLLIILHALR